MEKHFILTDMEFEDQFREGAINPAIFTHEAHLRLAWIHIHRYGEHTAIENICGQLKNFTRKLGAQDKYNETVTVAAIKAVHHFMQHSPADNFKDFIDENPRLKTGFKELLSHHYQSDIFNSSTAKEKFLPPELLPFE